MPIHLVSRVLEDFNAGDLDAFLAARTLGVSRSRLYQLRAAFLQDKPNFQPGTSGGNHREKWPSHARQFLEEFLPLQNPPNYQLVADELLRLHGLKRARSSVEAYVKTHFPHLLPSSPKKPGTYRRFRRAHIGELWQHDSSIHQWWPAERKQLLLLTVDDHSGLNIQGSFVEADTTWNHFLHFRNAFQRWGIPEIVYTDGLSLFGASSADDRLDPKSEFQRALRGLEIAHLVAPTPQAKGKIERRFGTFQGRMVTLSAHAKTSSWAEADEVLQMEIARQNSKKCRSTHSVPVEVWEKQTSDKSHRMRPVPASRLLDLHLSLRFSRRVNNDHTIDFEGMNYEIAYTHKKSVTIVHHPKQRFWVVEHLPNDIWPPILGAFSL